MKKSFIMTVMACTLGMFASCSSDDGATTAPAGQNEFGDVSVVVGSATRAGSIALDPALTDLTATSACDLGDGATLVTYHGRNQTAGAAASSVQKGMLQIVKGNEVSELSTVDARINYAAYDNATNTVYVGLDRNWTNAAVAQNKVCAVAVIKLTADKKFPTDLTTIEGANIVPLDGISVNNLSVNNGEVAIATSSNAAYPGAFFTLSGSTLTKVNAAAAYWFNNNTGVKVWRTAEHSADCVALYDGQEFAFTSTDAEDGVKNTYGRVSAEALTIGETDYFFTCGDALVAYSKVNGSWTNMNEADESKSVSNSYCTNVATDGTYVYACNGSRVSQYYLRVYDHQDKVRFELKAKYDATAVTGETIIPSANQLFCQGGKVYVAYGWAGLKVLEPTDFVPAN